MHKKRSGSKNPLYPVLTAHSPYKPQPVSYTHLDVYKRQGAYRNSLPAYASGNFHGTVQEYVDEALHYKALGIPGYKAHPAGPVSFDMEVHQALRDAVGPDYVLMSDPVGEYTMGDAVAVGRQLERLNFKWLEEPFRDFELYKYTELCRTLEMCIRDSSEPSVRNACPSSSSSRTFHMPSRPVKMKGRPNIFSFWKP